MVICDFLREKVYVALSNVKFLADETWLSSCKSEYIRKNQELWKSYQQTCDSGFSSNSRSVYILGNRYNGSPKLNEAATRTVRHVIPNSRLASYGNYPYDEGREFFYSICNEDNTPSKSFDLELFAAINDEPWMLPEVNYFFSIYTRFVPRRLNQSLKPYENKAKRHIINSGPCSTHPNYEWCYKNHQTYAKSNAQTNSSQLISRYSYLPRFVNSVIDPSINHHHFHPSFIHQNNFEYYDEFKLRGLIKAKSVQRLWIGENHQHCPTVTARSLTNPDPSLHGCRSLHPSFKYSQENSKRCQKQLYKRRQFLNVNVSEFRPKLKPRMYQVDDAVISCQLSPFLSVGNSGPFSSQPSGHFSNPMRSILPSSVTSHIPLSIYENPNHAQSQSFQLYRATSHPEHISQHEYLLSSANGPEKVAAALSKVKTWLKKIYPKRSRDLKKMKKTSAHPFTFNFNSHQDENGVLNLKSGISMNTKHDLINDVERCFDDLERQAMEQYQCSLENLFKKPITSSEEQFQDLEREALEQYRMNENEPSSSGSGVQADIVKSPAEICSKLNLVSGEGISSSSEITLNKFLVRKGSYSKNSSRRTTGSGKNAKS